MMAQMANQGIPMPPAMLGNTMGATTGMNNVFTGGTSHVGPNQNYPEREPPHEMSRANDKDQRNEYAG